MLKKERHILYNLLYMKSKKHFQFVTIFGDGC